jgi:hypothetical protein
MSLTLAPVAEQQFFDDNGDPLAGGKLWSFISGTSTPLSIYADANGITAYSNPLTLDAAGRPGPMYFQTASYKLYLTDTNGVPVGPVGGYTDPVASTALASSAIGGALYGFGGEEETPITATSYPSGATYDTCHADTTWFSIDSANLVGAYSLQAQMKSVGGVTTSGALVNLSDGAPDTPIATVTSTSSTGDRQISSAITFAPGGSAKVYGVKTKVSSGSGFAWQIQLIRTA